MRHYHKLMRARTICLVLGILCFIAGAAITGYRTVKARYHAQDLPSSNIFTPEQVWYTEDHLADHPVINAVADNPEYDEMDFMQIYDVTPDENGVEPEVPEHMNDLGFSPKPGHIYQVEIYCRNGADPKYNMDGYGMAENVRCQVYLPHKFTSKTRARQFYEGSYVVYDAIRADIAADNIYPLAASTAIEIYSSNDLRLEYVAGSAAYYGSDYPDGQEFDGKWLFAPGGTLLDAALPGGREYACLIKFRFEVFETNWYPWDAVIYDFRR